MCYSCGEDAILEVDGSAGNSVCTRCGSVRPCCARGMEATWLTRGCRCWRRTRSCQRSPLARLAAGLPWSRDPISARTRVRPLPPPSLPQGSYSVVGSTCPPSPDSCRRLCPHLSPRADLRLPRRVVCFPAARARLPAGYRQKGGGQESREQTIQNGTCGAGASAGPGAMLTRRPTAHRSPSDPGSRGRLAPGGPPFGGGHPLLSPRGQHELCPGPQDAVRRRGVPLQRLSHGGHKSHAHRLLRLARGELLGLLADGSSN